MRSSFNILVEKPEGKSHKNRGEDNIKINTTELGVWMLLGSI